eukprot:COSAG05_NODE_72_length_21963_cov_153.494535_1_plen_473_part_00
MRVAAWITRQWWYPTRWWPATASHAADIEVRKAPGILARIDAIFLPTPVCSAAVANTNHLVDLRALRSVWGSAIVSPSVARQLWQLCNTFIGADPWKKGWDRRVLWEHAQPGRCEGCARYALAACAGLAVGAASWDSSIWIARQRAERATAIEPLLAIPAPACTCWLRVAVRGDTLRFSQDELAVGVWWRRAGADHRGVFGARVDDCWVVSLRLALARAPDTLSCLVQNLARARWLPWSPSVRRAGAPFAARTLLRHARPCAENALHSMQHGGDPLEVWANGKLAHFVERRFSVTISLRKVWRWHGRGAGGLAYCLVVHIAKLHHAAIAPGHPTVRAVLPPNTSQLQYCRRAPNIAALALVCRIATTLSGAWFAGAVAGAVVSSTAGKGRGGGSGGESDGNDDSHCAAAAPAAGWGQCQPWPPDEGRVRTLEGEAPHQPPARPGQAGRRQLWVASPLCSLLLPLAGCLLQLW